ncbi:MAG: hypothetical protein IJJ99_07005 [Oscillospiraceae bacterium]|nr:hypothetical protein [Oscillospiraceae bacterium]
MKSLKTIQVLSKIGRILSKIVFVFCIVGFCGCLLGIVSLAFGFESFKIGNVTIRGIIEDKAEMNIPSVYAAMSAGIVSCAAEAVLAKFAEHYFRNELNDGTPFTYRGAKELKRLGILSIVIPLAATIVCSIGIGIAKNLYPEIELKELAQGVSFGLGIMMIVMSVVCRYGAELREGKPEETSETE